MRHHYIRMRWLSQSEGLLIASNIHLASLFWSTQLLTPCSHAKQVANRFGVCHSIFVFGEHEQRHQHSAMIRLVETLLFCILCIYSIQYGQRFSCNHLTEIVCVYVTNDICFSLTLSPSPRCTGHRAICVRRNNRILRWNNRNLWIALWWNRSPLNIVLRAMPLIYRFWVVMMISCRHSSRARICHVDRCSLTSIVSIWLRISMRTHGICGTWATVRVICFDSFDWSRL